MNHGCEAASAAEPLGRSPTRVGEGTFFGDRKGVSTLTVDGGRGGSGRPFCVETLFSCSLVHCFGTLPCVAVLLYVTVVHGGRGRSSSILQPVRRCFLFIGRVFDCYGRYPSTTSIFHVVATSTTQGNLPPPQALHQLGSALYDAIGALNGSALPREVSPCAPSRSGLIVYRFVSRMRVVGMHFVRGLGVRVWLRTR